LNEDYLVVLAAEIKEKFFSLDDVFLELFVGLVLRSIEQRF
jgi:hypothetical protein